MPFPATVPRLLRTRPVVFLLAAQSFVCLIGQLYGLWPMSVFACVVLVPATGLLVLAALPESKGSGRAGEARTWVIEGAIGGVAAAAPYDPYRLPFRLAGCPPLKGFPAFLRI